MRSGASVSQPRAESWVPRGARTMRVMSNASAKLEWDVRSRGDTYEMASRRMRRSVCVYRPGAGKGRTRDERLDRLPAVEARRAGRHLQEEWRRHGDPFHPAGATLG